MNGAPDANGLAGAWRRFDSALDQVRQARDATSQEQIVDAVTALFDTTYPLWEAWQRAHGLSSLNKQDDAVAGDPTGELVAALVSARGAQTHKLVEFGVPRAYGQGRYGVGRYGVNEWLWQAHEDHYTERRTRWYADHLSGWPVVETVERAAEWLRAQPELKPS